MLFQIIRATIDHIIGMMYDLIKNIKVNNIKVNNIKVNIRVLSKRNIFNIFPKKTAEEEQCLFLYVRIFLLLKSE